MASRTAAVVGAVGGAGATRLSIECAGTLARAGNDVLVVDCDFATQGLADFVPGPVAADSAAVLTGEDPLSAATTRLEKGTEGRLTVCPARSPVERFARATSADAARRLGRFFDAPADVVLFDVPPVVDNPSIAAVTECDRVALVAPDTARGAAASARVRDRLADVGSRADALVATRTDEATHLATDATVPTTDVVDPAAVPTCASDPDPAFAPAVATATEAVLDVELDLSYPSPGTVARALRSV